MRDIALDNGGQGGHHPVMSNQPHNAGEPPKLDNGSPPSPETVGEPESLFSLTTNTGVDQGSVDNRSLAQFFFEQGFWSCFAEALASADGVPPFVITDAMSERCWKNSAIARDDYAEFDSRLALADAATELLAELEALTQAVLDASPSLVGRDRIMSARAVIAKARGETL